MSDDAIHERALQLIDAQAAGHLGYVRHEFFAGIPAGPDGKNIRVILDAVKQGLREGEWQRSQVGAPIVERMMALVRKLSDRNDQLPGTQLYDVKMAVIGDAVSEARAIAALLPAQKRQRPTLVEAVREPKPGQTVECSDGIISWSSTPIRFE